MTLSLRHGSTRYELSVPRGSQIFRGSNDGRPILIVPGPRPQDTASWVGALEIVDAARRGHFGMTLRSVRRLGC